MLVLRKTWDGENDLSILVFMILYMVSINRFFTVESEILKIRRR